VNGFLAGAMRAAGVAAGLAFPVTLAAVQGAGEHAAQAAVIRSQDAAFRAAVEARFQLPSNLLRQPRDPSWWSEMPGVIPPEPHRGYETLLTPAHGRRVQQDALVGLATGVLAGFSLVPDCHPHGAARARGTRSDRPDRCPPGGGDLPGFQGPGMPGMGDPWARFSDSLSRFLPAWTPPPPR
jgi:hypothetical protein